MKSALVTGANKGIGFEVARQLAHKGIDVYLGSRSLENGLGAVNKLKSEGLNNVEAIQLDITGDESVKKARTEICKHTKKLDILINNAGIYGGYPQEALTATIEQFKYTYDANVFGVVRVTQAFIDLLKNPLNLVSSMLVQARALLLCTATLHTNITTTKVWFIFLQNQP